MNQSNLDRFIRILVGGALLIATSYITLHPVVFWAVTLLGIILLLTGLTGYCPIYHLFRIGTKK